MADRDERVAAATAIMEVSASGSQEAREIAEAHARALLGTKEDRDEFMKLWPIGREPQLLSHLEIEILRYKLGVRYPQYGS